MDTRSLELYESLDSAREAGVPEDHLVEVSGPQVALEEMRANLEKVRERETQHGQGGRND